jgi:putative phage-type endonuclease
MSYNILEWKDKGNWLEIRKTGIGGSDIGAICGYNKYKTPLDVWLDKMGQSLPVIENENMEWGIELERNIIRKFCQKTGYRSHSPVRINIGDIYQSKENLWALANVDGLVAEDKRQPFPDYLGVLECKYAPSLKIVRNDLPKHYILQLQWYLYVTGLPTGWLAILSVSHGTHFMIEEIKRNDKLIESMLKIGQNFWEEYVVKKIPPTPDWNNYSKDALAYFYPEVTNHEVLKFDDNASELVSAYQTGHDLIQKGQTLKEEASGKLKFLLGENESALTPNGYYVSHKEVITKRLNTLAIKEKYPDIAEECTQEQKSRRLNISEIKS